MVGECVIGNELRDYFSMEAEPVGDEERWTEGRKEVMRKRTPIVSQKAEDGENAEIPREMFNFLGVHSRYFHNEVILSKHGSDCSKN